ncbi:MAG: CPBP family intramembrane metalloprotease [Cyanobacteria bacterium SZAS TMP-1]|nr:CPBP family intramembrane metalloprotease [Cyanobacteria bacterium SZAS TMP-1]
MFEPGEDDEIMPHLDRHSVLSMTIFAEIFVLVLATGWIFLAKLDLKPLLHCNTRAVIAGISAALLVTLLNLAILRLANKYAARFYLLKSMKDLIYKQMLPLMGHLTFADSIFIAIISGFCEEVFFRGVLQSQCGLVPAACAFGLAHLPRIYYFPYALWATYVGLLMGFLLIATDSLYSPIIAHALINFASINVLRRMHSTNS